MYANMLYNRSSNVNSLANVSESLKRMWTGYSDVYKLFRD